jgi:hypothetical protein
MSKSNFCLALIDSKEEIKLEELTLFLLVCNYGEKTMVLFFLLFKTLRSVLISSTLLNGITLNLGLICISLL